MVTMLIEEQYAPILRDDSTVLLRPRTGLQDMTLEIDAGHEGEPLEEGATIPLSQTEPNVQPDQILASLDGDTRAYLQLLLQGAGEGLGGNGKKLSAVFRRFEPLSRDLARIGEALAVRRDEHPPRDHHLQAGQRGARRQRHPPGGVRRLLERGPGRVRQPGGGDPRVAAGAAEHARPRRARRSRAASSSPTSSARRRSR